MAVTVSGMFGEVGGEVHTYFADSPVMIDISGLEWSRNGEAVTSPFTVVRVEVIYNNDVVGEFMADTGGQTEAHFDISSALKAIWSDYDFGAANAEVDTANGALTSSTVQTATRTMREYSLLVHTDYLDSTDNEFTTASFGPFTGGKCLMGGMTEWERSLIINDANRDVSALEHTNPRNGDASTKPTVTPERVGKNSITSWVDVNSFSTQSMFYPAMATEGADSQSPHAPLVLRDSQDYIDFLFVNRRGAVETCSGMTKEAMNIDVETKTYSRVERPTFRPSRSLTAIGSDGRRSWQMSSGYVTREWAEWWTMEFLAGKRKKWWMRYPFGSATAKFVPVIVEPAKKSVSIYDKTRQQMPHVDFTVTLGLEG